MSTPRKISTYYVGGVKHGEAYEGRRFHNLKVPILPEPGRATLTGDDAVLPSMEYDTYTLTLTAGKVWVYRWDGLPKPGYSEEREPIDLTKWSMLQRDRVGHMVTVVKDSTIPAQIGAAKQILIEVAPVMLAEIDRLTAVVEKGVVYADASADIAMTRAVKAAFRRLARKLDGTYNENTFGKGQGYPWETSVPKEKE